MTSIWINGAGPAGSSLALELVESGVPAHEITLADAAEFPRQKLCGGGLTAKANRYLDRWGIACASEIEAGAIRFVDRGHEQRIAEPYRLSTVDRWELDDKLRTLAGAKGVQLRHTRLQSMQKAGPDWLLQCTDGTARVRYVVGADGYSSIVRRTLLPAAARDWSGKLLECVVPADTASLPDDLVMDFNAVHQGIAGYYWIFPFRSAQDGALYIKYGVMDRDGAVSSADLRQFLRDFIRDSGSEPPAQLHGYPERYYRPLQRMVWPRAAVIGDAFGVEPLLGEGLGISFDHSAWLGPRLAQAWQADTAMPDWYNVGWWFGYAGWNHWFLHQLGNFVYRGKRDMWLGILTKDPALQAISQQPGFGGFGRFSHQAWPLTRLAMRHWMGRKSWVK